MVVLMVVAEEAEEAMVVEEAVGRVEDQVEEVVEENMVSEMVVEKTEVRVV